MASRPTAGNVSTMSKSYQEFASENLAGFGWEIATGDIPEYDTCNAAMVRLAAWWDKFDDETRDILRTADLSVGLWEKGYFDEWPGLYFLMSGNRMGRFEATCTDII